MPGVTAAGEVPALNYQGLTALTDVMGSKFPFNYLGQVGQIASAFVADGTPPVFTLPIYGGNTITIDLTPFDILATICRWGVAVLITIAGLQAAVNWWRGVS
jgi:hypothetical protein